MRDRKHIDWKKEIIKTEKIRSRGLKLSTLCFLFAVSAIGGVKFYTNDFKAGPLVLAISLAFFIVLVACIFLSRWGRGGRRI